jgi:hypothetical protein
MENSILALGSIALATDSHIRPDYELTYRVAMVVGENRKLLRPDGRLKIRYPGEGEGIFKPYQHQVRAGEYEGALLIESAGYLDGGSYCAINGIEGLDWRLLVVGNLPDVRRRFLVGNSDGFYEWVENLEKSGLLPVHKLTHHLQHDPNMRLRCGVSVWNLQQIVAALEEHAIGDWIVFDNRPHNYHVELEREEDVAICPTDFVIGTNWQGSHLVARRGTTAKLKDLRAS